MRFTVAEKSAKEAVRQASSFSSTFVTQMSPNLPADAGSIHDLCKAHHALVLDRKNEAQRDNDLIYNAVLPAPETLPAVDKASAALAPPIPIQEVYGTPEVQKVIGPDLFVRLVPLSVHESASVYSEEKAKLVRGEAEKADAAEQEVRAGLESLGVREGLARFRAMAEGGVEGDQEVPVDVRRWKEDISVMEQREGIETLLGRLNTFKGSVRKELEAVGRELETESRECEAMRVKFEHLWSQEPSGSLTKTLRQDLKAHLGALDAAAASDQQVAALWNGVKGDIYVLLSPQLEDVFRASTEGGAGQESLLDLDVGADTSDAERRKIGQFIAEIDDRLGKLNKISRERTEVLKDLKDKVGSIFSLEIMSLTILNRSKPMMSPTFFYSTAATQEWNQRCSQPNLKSSDPSSSDLDRPHIISKRRYRKLDSYGRASKTLLYEAQELKSGKSGKDGRKTLSDASPMPAMGTWKCEMDLREYIPIQLLVASLTTCRLRSKGLQFYNELTELGGTLRQSARSFVSDRTTERNRLAGQLETQKRLSMPASSAPPPLPQKHHAPPPPSHTPSGLDAALSSLSLGGGPRSPPPVPTGPPSNHWGGLPTSLAQAPYGSYQSHPPSQPPSAPPSSFLPPPPPPPPSATASSPPPMHDPYASLGMLGSFAPTPPPAQPQRPPPPAQPSYPPPQSYSTQSPYGAPPQAHHQHTSSYGAGYPPPTNQQPSYGQPAQAGGYGLLPPPAPYQQQQYGQPQYGQPPAQSPPPSGYPGFPPPPPSAPPGQYGQYQGYGR